MNNQIIILIGNVGSGKSEIARRLSKRGFKHIQIDDFFPKVERVNKKIPWYDDQEYIHKAYLLLFSEVKKQLKFGNSIVIDTTGVSIEWKWLNKRLNKIPKSNIIRIFLKVPIKVLKRRISQRNKKNIQIKTKINFVDYITKRRKIVKPKYDYIVDGNQSKKKVFLDTLKIIQSYNYSN